MASGDTSMTDFDRISAEPGVMNGQPCIKGTRLTVKRVLLVLAQYKDREEIRREYPQLQDEDIHQALEYAAANLDDEILELRTTP
jgi:uncharacterized protein (DUF433 family)